MRTASGEQKVISLITAQLFLVMGDVAIRSETEVEFTCADTEKGWKEIQDWIMGRKHAVKILKMMRRDNKDYIVN